jgi:hypothetical protein
MAVFGSAGAGFGGTVMLNCIQLSSIAYPHNIRKRIAKQNMAASGGKEAGSGGCVAIKYRAEHRTKRMRKEGQLLTISILALADDELGVRIQVNIPKGAQSSCVSSM